MTKDEAMKLALEALEEWLEHDTLEAMHIFETITVPETLQALRQALEQPEREWVGLTDEEILEAAGIDGADTWVFETAYAIEAKLKEKNG